jgi:hypothetical protein
MLQSSNTSRFNRTSKGFGFDEFTRYSSVMFGPRLCVKLMAQVNITIHRHVHVFNVVAGDAAGLVR